VIFQDLNIKEIIGEEYLENGLYFLSCNKGIFCSQKNEDLNKLWHKRLGHPSDKILKLMFNFSNIDCSNCETCKLAKQTKLSFCTFNSKSNEIFELVHSDV
jgi:GAG-pre-integrase domain